MLIFYRKSLEENIEKLKNIYQTLTELSNKDYCLQE